jgi:creatinine amidohydrolase
METSLLLHLRPDLVAMAEAGSGSANEWSLRTLQQSGVWTPRPWSAVHPDTGSGDPAAATAGKGREYFAAVTTAIAAVLVELSAATRGDLPYV